MFITTTLRDEAAAAAGFSQARGKFGPKKLEARSREERGGDWVRIIGVILG